MRKETKKLAKSLEANMKKRSKKDFNKGVVQAMCIAVNLFNMEDRVRQGVFKHFKIKL